MICWTPKLLSAQQDIRDLSCTAAASLIARRETVRPKSQMQPTIAIERRAGSDHVGVSRFLASKSQPLNRSRHKSRDFVVSEEVASWNSSPQCLAADDFLLSYAGLVSRSAPLSADFHCSLCDRASSLKTSLC